MACQYIIYKEGQDPIVLTYQELVEKYEEGDYRNVSDIIFEKDGPQHAMISQIKTLNKEFFAQVDKSENIINGEPNYTDNKKFTPQTFIDSGRFRPMGHQIIPEIVNENYIKTIADTFIAEGMDETEALIKAKKIVEGHEIVNSDAKDLHVILNKFNIYEYDPMSDIQKAESTKFYDVANSLFSQITQDGGLRQKIRSRHKVGEQSPLILRNINLTAKLNSGEDITGHFDTIAIDANGNVHVYNYKMTTTSLQEWSAVKNEKYAYQLALLKQILAYNGINVNKTQMYIVPVRVNYSEDLSTINSVNVYDAQSYLEVTDNKYERAAKYFIKSNVKLNPIKNNTIRVINQHLQDFFPKRGIKFEGIQKSVDSWIKSEYSFKWQNRIKKVDAEDHVYELYFDDEYKKPIFIKSPEQPLQNEEIRNHVEKHLQSVDGMSNQFLGKIIQEIQSSVSSRKPVINKSSSSRKMQAIGRFLETNLQAYISTYKKIDDEIVYEWDLISNDTLLDANILVFKNSKDQIDIVCLSDYNLNTKVDFGRFRTNIMGCWTSDASGDTGNLINYKSTYDNIEAIRTMTILNEVLPQLDESGLKLGKLKVISTHESGQATMYTLESLNRDLFQNCIKVVKKNNKQFDIKNNFATSKYLDPLTVLKDYYTQIIQTSNLSQANIQDFVDLGFANLENLHTRESKKVQLRTLIENIFKLDPTIQTMSEQELINSAQYDTNYKRRVLSNMYMMAQEALLYYSKIFVRREKKISSAYEYGLVQNRVNNPTYQHVVSLYHKTIDDIADMSQKEYSHIYNFTDKFYQQQGFGPNRASIIGDQKRAFNNLFRRDDNNNLLMEFRNPYKTDSQTPLTQAEQVYLKKVLFELAKYRSKIYGFDFNFISENDPKLEAFIIKNSSWYFNVPLQKASKATVRANGLKAMFKQTKDKLKRLLDNPKDFFVESVQNTFAEENEMMESALNSLSLNNPYTIGDGYGDESARKDLLNKYDITYFETNVENILADYVERYIRVRELNKTLITTKGILLSLNLMNNVAGPDNKQGIQQTVKMIDDFVKNNFFNISLMEPASQKISAWIAPFRDLVSKAYIAGNVVGFFRDNFEGFWQANVRMLTKYQTDLKPQNFYKSYKDVVQAAFTNLKDVTIVDALCRTYRLSNMDVARISDQLTTSRGGVLNVEKWLYATMRVPDFLNRMILFVARCKQDGCWDAFSMDGNTLVYDWKKDKRYSIFADSSKKGTKEYEEQRIAYYNAVRKYNQENPDKAITFDQYLPVAYSNEQVQQIRQLSNSIYGAYDQSMRAKYETMFVGLNFAMFTTWMNGAVANYFTKPGTYVGGVTHTEQRRDGSGNLLFFDDKGNYIIQIDNGTEVQYIYEETGEKVENSSIIMPVINDVPDVIQGIFYTYGNALQALLVDHNFKEEIWDNPMQRANLLKGLSDILLFLLFYLIFKLALDPAYKDYKKEMKDYSVLQNAFVEVMYKSSSKSYDGFAGPIGMITYLGEDTTPPPYQLTTKIGKDICSVLLGDKAVHEIATGNISLFRAFNDTRKAVERKYKEQTNE